ncbi:metallophosphoesterase [Arcticibacterium luteifluviistationis]|uniref:Metallophosphoesterase n=2 Tax=Arcticibacterium luteifluviistationis TaxID=1784714 RepID=A0A2Z4GHU7_9BACT|nr:metallophosphoesterase [Arcticibacterium luteifluviistationis]
MRQYPDHKLLFPSNVPDRIILNLTEDPLTSVAVNWRTSLNVTEGFIEYAKASHGPEFRKNPNSIKAITESLTVAREEEPIVKANYHSGIIKNLEPGQKYVYRVGGGESWSEWFQVSMPGKDSPISFVYFGDAQNDVKSMWSRIIREAYHTMPQMDFLLHAGDLINRHDRDVEWGEWFHAGGFIHSQVPSVMTPGNHEYKNVKLSPQWRPQFNLPQNGVPGLEETNYEINYPEMKVISLDGEQIDESLHYRKAQAAWLDSILTYNPKKWTVVTMHYPVYSTKSNRDNVKLRETLKPIFDKHKVDLVLQGHDHAYGRGNVGSGTSFKSKEGGTMYVVSVSGPKMYAASDEDNWMERRTDNTQLFQVITVAEDLVHYKAFTGTGELYDSFILKKNGNKANVLINQIPDTPERRQIKE